LLEDDTISTFEDGKYVDEVQEVIMELLAMNVSMSKVNEVINSFEKIGREKFVKTSEQGRPLSPTCLG